MTRTLTLACSLIIAAFAHAQDCNPMQVLKIHSDNPGNDDEFGWSVDICAETALVGAPLTDFAGLESGVAYIFALTETGWQQQWVLLPDNASPFDFIGGSVALATNTAVVGAYRQNPDNVETGAAHVFIRDTDTFPYETWPYETTLLADDGLGGDQFGFAVAINETEDIIVVGAPGDDDNGLDAGSAYVFTRDNGVWTQEAKLLAPTGGPRDLFGSSVAVDGETIVVGAPTESAAGSALVFTRINGTWTFQAELTPDDGAPGDSFGWDVAIDGDSLIVGAYSATNNSAGDGAAYVFVRNGTDWTQQAELLPDDGMANDFFGLAVDIHADAALVSAPYVDLRGTNSGAAYLFTRDMTTWTQQAKISSSGARTGDYFGWDAAICANDAIFGSPFDSAGAPQSGSAYIFDLNCITCPADLDGNGTLDADDFFLFLDLFTADDPAADIDGNGVIDGNDFFAYLDLFAAGC